MLRKSLVILALFFPLLLGAQFFDQENLIDATDATSATTQTGQQYENRGVNTSWWFNLDVTAINTGSVYMVIQYYDPTAEDWATWYTGAAVSSVTSSQMCISSVVAFTAPAATGCDQELTMPMPAIWRIKVSHSESLTASYTVDYWRH